jgi:hypothetical protein
MRDAIGDFDHNLMYTSLPPPVRERHTAAIERMLLNPPRRFLDLPKRRLRSHTQVFKLATSLKRFMLMATDPDHVVYALVMSLLIATGRLYDPREQRQQAPKAMLLETARCLFPSIFLLELKLTHQTTRMWDTISNVYDLLVAALYADVLPGAIAPDADNVREERRARGKFMRISLQAALATTSST